MTDDEISKQKQWALDRAYSILTEHFDTVLVIAAARMPEDRTIKLARNAGDVYACIGLAMTFAKRQMDYLNTL